MNFLFWQNTNSIHQSSFLNALAKNKDFNVHLIVTEPLNSFRKGMGWTEPVLNDVIVHDLNEKNQDISQLIINNSGLDSIHIFSGIAAFPKVHQAFKFAIKKKCRVAVFTEPLDFRRYKGKIRELRGFFFKFKYENKIEFVLTTGKLGIAQFNNWGYPESKIFEWSYTVRESNVKVENVKNSNEGDPFKIMFAGSFIKRKGYDILIQALKSLEKNNFIADFYCLRESDFEQGKLIEKESGLGSKLNLLPFLSNDNLRIKMNEYDLFILPSRHDGWGAVVTESLMEGTPVIASYNCGSSTQLTDFRRGKILLILDKQKLSEEIKLYMEGGKTDKMQRLQNREWALNHISGDAMAVYFVKIVDYLNKKNEKPNCPWSAE